MQSPLNQFSGAEGSRRLLLQLMRQAPEQLPQYMRIRTVYMALCNPEAHDGCFGT